MTVNNIRQQILEHLDILPSEQVKTLLLTWLSSSEGDLEDFERLLTNQPTQTTEESFKFGEVDAALNFQPITEAEMVEQSKFALIAYRSKGSGVPHNLVREWADSLGTEARYGDTAVAKGIAHVPDSLKLSNSPNTGVIKKES